jgi:glycosyltransferase involved in cell wall biosynthesis
MLPQDWIVRRGDPMAIAQRILEWLQDPDHLRREQSRARELAARFLWHDIAAGTIDTYERSIRVLRDGAFAVGPKN